MARRNCLTAVLCVMLLAVQVASAWGASASLATGPMVVLGYNDLGMHCMNEDFSQFMVLPPYNVLHAQVIDRTTLYPRRVESGVTVDYTIPGNTHSADKTNFWTYGPSLLGLSLTPNIGLTGNGLTGTMAPTALGDWEVTGIPITPLTDAGVTDAYQLATITVTSGAVQTAQTQAVVPVSWEISCNLCHGVSADDPLAIHDDEEGTNLRNSTPVFCGSCHAQPPLGSLSPGQSGVPTLSRSMHSFHASEIESIPTAVNGVICYACHPGITTQCLRDVHYSAGMTCTDCHGSLATVGSAGRRPWVDEPKCSDCHNQPGSAYEQPNTLYRDSRGHGGLHCEACHGSPHAITPTVKTNDNVQAIAVQGHPGTIDVCTVCHATQPTGAFVHRWLFPDLTDTFWARDQIYAAYSAGIVQGFSDDTYRPSVTITRDAMAVFVARAVAGGDANVPAFTGTASFTDVPTTHWASKYVEYAKSAGVVAGYTDGLYHPNETVDRGQMAAFVARSIASPTGEPGLLGYVPPTTPSFSDVPTSFWAYKYIEYCAAQSVVLGFTDGAYHPEYAVTRDQMAVYLARGFHLPTS